MMIRTCALVALLTLGGCGGSQYANQNAVTSAATRIAPGVAFARGPISRACMAAGRSAATAARCSCVQAVADRRLSPADQRQGAKFFSDPHQAQVVRMSDNPGHEAFWLRWKAYGQEAGRICS